ncbi:MAG: leukotoxin LktA family filamentous adhesin, partial [Alphaproteobacteria bacterium]|nr:leukotoxin LktA family filamentous adhesin [Alphaproteobacteria bacterium]
MKYSRSAITQLTKWYRQILIKCAILNAAVMTVSFGGTAQASDITGITPTNGNTYNIEALKVSGSTGFREYNNFTLDDGDIANLIYKIGYDKFVNLVNNQVNINGIVNTMRDNNFFNGHAIFVSPNGVVIGASGVLNVGSLTLATPSQSKFDAMKNAYSGDTLSNYEVGKDKYKEILTDSHGNVVINGKIMARGDVEVYGDTITVKGTAQDKAGIIAGVKNQEILTDKARAKEVFNSLVSNNISDTADFALENGKIKIIAGFKDYTGTGEDRKPDGAADKAEVIIENAQIGGNDIEIKANSTKEGLYTLADADEAVSSRIDITDSNITGDNIDIAANSDSSLSRNLNLTVPAVVMWVFDSDSHVDDFFSDGVYNGFEGVRTSATVNIINSVLNSTGDLSISAESSSDTNIGPQALDPTEVSQFVPAIFYGYGTKTEAKINIKDSTLNADGDVDLRAFSNNVLYAKIADEVVAGFTLKATDAFNLAFMKNSAIADTKITIDHSNISGENVTAEAIAYNEMDNRNILKPRIGNNDWVDMSQEGGQGGSAFSLAGILNATDIKSSIEVKNESEISATEDVTLNAYNINDVSNWVDSEITDPLGYNTEYTAPDAWYKKPFDLLGRLATGYDQIHTFTLKDFATKFTNKAKNIGTQ